MGIIAGICKRIVEKGGLLSDAAAATVGHLTLENQKLKDRIQALEESYAKDPDDHNMRSMALHFDQQIRIRFEKFISESDYGKLKDRVGGLYDLMEVHNHHMMEFRVKLAHMTLDTPINQEERRAFIGLCRAFAETAAAIQEK